MKRLAPPLLALFAGALSLALTLGLWRHEQASEQGRLRAILEFELRQAATRIEQRVANYEQMLRGAQGLFLTAGRVDAATFDRYVAAVMAGPDAAGLQAFAFNAAVRADGLAAHESARRADGAAGYAVHPPGDRALYAPLAYFSPPPPAGQLLGQDPLTEPARRSAMLQARDSGNLAITGRVRLAVDPPQSPASAFLVYLPIYAAAEVPPTLERRRAEIAGWVSASFRITDLMSTLAGQQGPGLRLRLFDGAGAEFDPDSLMFRSGPASEADRPARYQAQETIAFAGHAWTLQLSSLPAFQALHGQDSARVILVAGTGLSLLLALLVQQLVTGRARAHAAAQAMTRELRESEERYRRIVETAGEGIWLLDAGHRIAFANPRLAQWLGLPESEMAGRPIEEFMAPEDAARCRQALAAAPGGNVAPLELRLRRRDGSGTWVSMTTRPILDDVGLPAGALGMLTDIDARRSAEERRGLLEAQLRDSQKMEAIGTLAGGIAHDFNNILAAILGNVAVARQDAAEGLPTDGSLAQIERAAVRARSLVQQILTFSRMQAQELQTQALQPVIEETLQMLRAAMPAQVQLVVIQPESPVHVRADATQIQQIVMNLCTNAWHALPGGRGRIEVGLEARDGEAHLWIADDGSGMDDATRGRVFEPFFTTKQVGQGTGLGLAVVHGIVSVHGGSIQVRSEPGRGSRFDVRFPLQAAPAPLPAAGPAEPVAAAPRGTGQHVLCVDDDPSMVLMMESLLQRTGYRVTAYEEPLLALAAAQADPSAFDVVVSDYNMPAMNGMELAESLARTAPRLPVIITSGFISDDMRVRAQELRIGALLQKEYTLERLAGLVHAVLAARAPVS